MIIIQEGQRASILNQAITIVADEPQDQGAPTRYRIRLKLPAVATGEMMEVELPFQTGAVGADGSNVNGISDESLIEVLIHRLKAFQETAWASETNAAAIDHLTRALQSLEHRTAKRREAGVEGTTGLTREERGYLPES